MLCHNARMKRAKLGLFVNYRHIKTSIILLTQTKQKLHTFNFAYAESYTDLFAMLHRYSHVEWPQRIRNKLKTQSQ